MLPGTFASMFRGGNPIEYIGNSGKFATTANSITVNYHASSQAGDLLFLFVQADDVDTINKPSGWTQIINRDDNRGGCKGAIFYRTQGNEDSVYVSGPADHICAAVLSFRHFNASNPYKRTPTQIYSYDNLNDGYSRLDAITTEYPNCFVMFILFHDHVSAGATTSGWDNNNLDSTSELIDISTTYGWDGGFAVWGGYKETAGSTGSCGVTTVDDGGWTICLAIAINPDS